MKPRPKLSSKPRPNIILVDMPPWQKNVAGIASELSQVVKQLAKAQDHLVSLEARIAVEQARAGAEDIDLLELIDWMRQTVHRAYHTGPMNECRKGSCQAAMEAIARDGRIRLGGG